jgi:endoglucanase
MTLARRDFLVSGLAAVMSGGAAATARADTPDLDPALWRDFVRRFVTTDGRVVDTGNGGITHSEACGYGLVLAVAARDKAAFRRIWSWTRSNLLVRPDGLAAWQWIPGKGLADLNNATDGDLLIAWAAVWAGEVWGEAEYATVGRSIAGAMRERLLVTAGDLTLLLPGAEGFRRGGGLVLNPSYLIFPAFRALEKADRSGPWAELARSALTLIAKARIGATQLPPDWLELGGDGTVSLPDGFKHQYGYDAIRVPLYLAWGGYRDAYYFRPFATLAARVPTPAIVTLPQGTTSPVAASAGMMAIYRLAQRLAEVGDPGPAPTLAADEDYYSTALFLLSAVAERSLRA